MSNETNNALDFDEKHQKDLERLRSLCLMDDDFMTKVFEDPACAEFLLQIILERNDIRVTEVHTQYDLKNLQGRSARLDILAVTSAGEVMNVEVQRNDKGATPKRARYNSSLLDANISEPGSEYQHLAETFVIFITENDVLRGGLPIYHIDRTIREMKVSFGDKSHIIYVNSQIRDETALGKLMHDFTCTSAADMKYTLLADRVHYFKEDEKGVTVMCQILEDMRKEEANKKMIEIALRMIKRGKLTPEEIAEDSGLPLEKVVALATNKTA